MISAMRIMYFFITVDSLISRKSAQRIRHSERAVNKQQVIVYKQPNARSADSLMRNIFTEIYRMKTVRFKRVQFYLALGAAWLLLWLISFVNYQDTFLVHALNEFWLTIFIVGANFAFYEFALPLIIRKRSNLLYSIFIGVFLVTLHLLIVSFGLYGWVLIGKTLDIYTQLRHSILSPDGPYYRLLDEAFYHGETGVASILFFGEAKVLDHNFTLRQMAQQMMLEKQAAELNYLKSQTNPHFLFNTLNNIYSLSISKSDLAAESILRLSKILRFMLYETNDRFISIHKEVEIITDYIELEKLRYDDSLQVDFHTDVDDQNQQIPPLLLVPLVENAFKHGVSETGNNAFLIIKLAVNNSHLKFCVENSAGSEDKPIVENIGLTNLRRQLGLLYSDYDLDVRHRDSVFTAELKINLAGHV